LARRAIGRTGVEVTAMGLGAAPLSGFRGRLHEAEATGIVRSAYDAGLRYIDTSPYYGYGRSELVVGQVLRELPRESFVLSTKIGRWLAPLRAGDSTDGLRQGGLGFKPTFDYTYDGTMRSIEQSWMRLGMGEIDILYIHDVDSYTHGAAVDLQHKIAVEGAYRALADLRRDRVVGAIGVGLNTNEACLRFARETDIDVILLAGRYTLLEQGALDELLPLCEQKGIAVVLGGPFNSGVLVTGPVEGASYNYGRAPEEVLERVRRIQAVCNRHAVPMPAAALQFPLAHPAMVSVIPGPMSRADLAQNIDWMRLAIPADLWAELRAEGLLHEAAPVPGG
jgi:D-threo-aldose 1-dehydrogenase